MDSAKYKDGKLTAIYLKEEVAGFAVHLVQKIKKLLKENNNE